MTGGQSRARFQLVPLHELEIGDEPLWLVAGLIPSTGVAVVYGTFSVGKTFIVLDLVMHVALGIPYRGRPVEQGAVVYIIAESISGFRRRCVAIRQENVAHGSRPPFYVVAGSMSLITEHEELVRSVLDALNGSKPAIVVIDTLNKTLRGSETNDQDMAAYYRAAEAVHQALGCVVIIVHHSGWDPSHMRGHSSLPASVDTSLAIRRAKSGDIVMRVEKQREGEDTFEIASRLRVVEIGTDKHGEPITSCIVEPVEASPSRRYQDKPQPTKLSGDIALAYTELQRLDPPVSLEEWRAALGGAFAGKKPGARRQAILHVRNTLEREGLILIDGETVSVRNASI